MTRSRRSVLHFAAAIVGSSVAGCSTIDSSSTEAHNSSSTQSATPTDSATPTTSPTETPFESAPVSLSGEVLHQATADKPTQLRARLENQHTESVRVGFGPTLLFTDNSASDNLEWANKLVIKPETYIGPWDSPNQDAEGCWRYDGIQAVQSILEWRELAPGDSVAETYSVYTSGTSVPCLPEGTYRFQDKGYLGDEDTPLLVTLSVNVDGDQQVTVKDSETGVSMN